MKLDVRIIPNSKRFEIKEENNRIKIYLKSRAEKGKANIELVKALSKALGKSVRIIRGEKSRNKVIEVEGTEREVLEAVKNKCSE